MQFYNKKELSQTLRVALAFAIRYHGLFKDLELWKKILQGKKLKCLDSVVGDIFARIWNEIRPDGYEYEEFVNEFFEERE